VKNSSPEAPEKATKRSTAPSTVSSTIGHGAATRARRARDLVPGRIGLMLSEPPCSVGNNGPVADSASPPAALISELRGTIRDPRALEAISAIPRPRFVPAAQRRHAWRNVALPIACGQTISQPLVVARMLELLALDGTERVLDVGTGSGYHAALLGHLASEVVSLERHDELAETAAALLAELGIDNVEVVVTDGSRGWPPRAPYGAINVAAAAGSQVPRALVAQLAVGGRLVAPITPTAGNPADQRLVLIRREPWGFAHHLCEAVRFVPLVLGPDPDGGASPPPPWG
jgi:protein-L-isoaspartate(D-aspartate) O-methyltransferase